MFHLGVNEDGLVLHHIAATLAPLGVRGVELYKDVRRPGTLVCSVQGLVGRAPEFSPWDNVTDACVVFRRLKANLEWGCPTRIKATITHKGQQLLARLPALVEGHMSYWDHKDSRIPKIPVECALAMSLLLSVSGSSQSLHEFYIQFR